MQKEEQAKIDEAEPLNEEELEEKENLLSQVNPTPQPTGVYFHIFSYLHENFKYNWSQCDNIKLLILVWIVLSNVSTF